MLLAVSFSQRAVTMSACQFTQRAGASPDAQQKPLVRKRARSGSANHVHVTREKSPSKAKKPRTAGSQQPACQHEEHRILSTSQASAFAPQFWEKKAHPHKASQHEFLATCINVDLEQNVKHAPRQKNTRNRGHQTSKVQNNESSLLSCLQLRAPNCEHVHPPTHTFPKQPFLFRTDFQKHTHTPPPAPPR